MFIPTNWEERSEEPQGTMNFQFGLGFDSPSTFATEQ